MRLIPVLLLLICFASAAHATTLSQDELHFVASLHLGAAPQVRYLDANGKPLDYAAFAQQLSAGRRHYSIARDSHAGMAVLRLRPAGARAGEPGRFAFGRGDMFPPFELPSLQGGAQRLGDFLGRYTLVSFFFAECAPCIAEVPTLNAYAREHGDLNFVAITYEDAATARQFVKQHGLSWNVLYDGQPLTDTLGIGTFPTLMLIDPSGRVAGAAVGMSMQDDPAQRLADLGGWIEQWKRALSSADPLSAWPISAAGSNNGSAPCPARSSRCRKDPHRANAGTRLCAALTMPTPHVLEQTPAPLGLARGKGRHVTGGIRTTARRETHGIASDRARSACASGRHPAQRTGAPH